MLGREGGGGGVNNFSERRLGKMVLNGDLRLFHLSYCNSC